MKRVLVDVDTQVDFMSPQGALFVPAASSTSRALNERLRRASERLDDYVAVLGSVDSHAYDAWEFHANGGPFPAHCVKGQPGWCRTFVELPARQRFIPMGEPVAGRVSVRVGEDAAGAGARTLDAEGLAAEALKGVGLYFEKEVYSLFSNGLADPVIAALVSRLGGADAVMFDVIGYCTGGYCVDAAVEGLLTRGYQVTVQEGACAAIGGADGMRKSKEALGMLGAIWEDAAPHVG
jgi:nicotinamidase/pyrazinamidase